MLKLWKIISEHTIRHFNGALSSASQGLFNKLFLEVLRADLLILRQFSVQNHQKVQNAGFGGENPEKGSIGWNGVNRGLLESW